MAKLEDKNKKLRKGKKRRRENQQTVDSDDEVAAKSLIVDRAEMGPDSQQQSVVQDKITKPVKPNNKRVLPDAQPDAIKSKRSRTESEADSGAHEAATEDTDLPTLMQLAEAEKPENLNAIVTVRQKKKQKHQQRVEDQKGTNCDKEMKRNVEYLHKWKYARSEWKFEKLRQISIQHTMFDESKLNTELWTIALEYLSGSKGAAKQTISKLAVDMIEKLDKEVAALEDESTRHQIINSVRYQRSRALLQHFD